MRAAVRDVFFWYSSFEELNAMLDLMRRHAKNWLIWIFLGLVILAFVLFFGTGDLSTISRRDRNVLFEIGDKQVSRFQVIILARAMANEIRLKEGRDPTEKRMKKIRKQAEEQLAQWVLLSDTANRLGMAVSPEEVGQVVTSLFRARGRFDRGGYLRYLKELRIKPEQYEGQLRYRLETAKVRAAVSGLVTVSQAEVYNFYVFRRETVKVRYVAVDPAKFLSKVKVGAAEARAYYQKHKAQFIVPPMVRVRYLAFFVKEYKAKAKVTPGTIKSYYDLNRALFRVQRKMRVRHILFRLPKDAPEQLVVKIKKKAIEVLALVKKAKGEKAFAALAKKYTEEPGAADRGGDLGYFKPGTMVGPFDAAAKRLKKGEHSGLVRTRFGFHILFKVDDQPSRIRPLKEVRGQIVALLRGRLGREAAEKTAWRTFDRVAGTPNLATFGRKNKMRVYDSGYFPRKGAVIEGVGPDDKFVAAGFGLAKGETSGLVKGKKGFYILQRVGWKASKVAAFEEVKGKAVELAKVAAAKAAARAMAAGILANLKKGGTDLGKLAKKRNLMVQVSPKLSRMSPALPPMTEKLKQAAFGLYKDRPYTDRAIEALGKFYVLEFASRDVPTRKAFLSDKDLRVALEKGLSGFWGRYVFRQFLSQLMGQAGFKRLRKL